MKNGFKGFITCLCAFRNAAQHILQRDSGGDELPCSSCTAVACKDGRQGKKIEAAVIYSERHFHEAKRFSEWDILYSINMEDLSSGIHFTF